MGVSKSADNYVMINKLSFMSTIKNISKAILKVHEASTSSRSTFVLTINPDADFVEVGNLLSNLDIHEKFCNVKQEIILSFRDIQNLIDKIYGIKPRYFEIGDNNLYVEISPEFIHPKEQEILKRANLSLRDLLIYSNFPRIFSKYEQHEYVLFNALDDKFCDHYVSRFEDNEEKMDKAREEYFDSAKDYIKSIGGEISNQDVESWEFLYRF